MSFNKSSLTYASEKIISRCQTRGRGPIGRVVNKLTARLTINELFKHRYLLIYDSKYVDVKASLPRIDFPESTCFCIDLYARSSLNV